MDKKNIEKLLLFMQYNDITLQELAQVLKITPPTLKKRLNGQVDFTFKEIDNFFNKYGFTDTQKIFLKDYNKQCK